jgi:hypothetical protein
MNWSAAGYALSVFLLSVLASQFGPFLALQYLTKLKPTELAPKINGIADLWPGRKLPKGVTDAGALVHFLESEATRNSENRLLAAVNAARTQYAAVLSIAALCLAESVVLTIFKLMTIHTIIVLVVGGTLLLVLAAWPLLKKDDPFELRAHIEKQRAQSDAKTLSDRLRGYFPPLRTPFGILRVLLIVSHLVLLYYLAAISVAAKTEPTDDAVGSRIMGHSNELSMV